MTPYQIMITRHKHEKNLVTQFQVGQEGYLKRDYDNRIAAAQTTAQKRQLRSAYSAAKRQLKATHKAQNESMKVRHKQERESIRKIRL